MKMPIETKPLLWGIVGGALALAILGFGWGGWTTAGKATSSARTQVDEAVVAALAPVCVQQFRSASDAPVNLETLRRLDYSSQNEFVEKGGWAKVPGNNSAERVSAVARACSALLLTSA